jgi:hypothetical protein
VPVISLAAQLGAGAHTLIKFLNTVSDAPAEIQRLESLLDQNTRSQHVSGMALNTSASSTPMIMVLADDIQTSLRRCQKKVQGIKHIVDRFKGTENGRRVVSRKWASFKLALKEEDVLGLERQLGLAIQILDISLTTHSL